MMHELYKYLLGIFREFTPGSGLAKPLAALAVIIAILVIARLLHYLTKFILKIFIQKVVYRTRTEWDDILVRKKVFNGIAHLVPLFFIYSSCFFAAPVLEKPLSDFSADIFTQLKADYYFQLGPTLLKWARIYFIFTIVYILVTLLNAGNDIYQTTPYSHHRPVKGYIQLLQILIIFLAVIMVISVLVGKDPTVLLAGLGAMAAVLMLVFKDTILGFVASIQLSANKMVKIGDWIEMPARNADGTVLDITLNTVKVQNWDKTITTVPTYSLVTESFVNWIGMTEAEGRRIKRSVLIDIFSIQVCTAALLQHLEKFELIRELVREKAAAFKLSGTQQEGTQYPAFNGPLLTNIGLFRIYLELFLNSHPDIHQSLDVVVRLLQSTEKGVPLEVVIFSKEKSWKRFEDIQAGIFEHIFAILPEFGLKAFQAPTGLKLS
jgi:miniconductance mechanosensitive channel